VYTLMITPGASQQPATTM